MLSLILVVVCVVLYVAAAVDICVDGVLLILAVAVAADAVGVDVVVDGVDVADGCVDAVVVDGVVAGVVFDVIRRC